MGTGVFVGAGTVVSVGVEVIPPPLTFVGVGVPVIPTLMVPVGVNIPWVLVTVGTLVGGLHRYAASVAVGSRFFSWLRDSAFLYCCTALQ